MIASAPSKAIECDRVDGDLIGSAHSVGFVGQGERMFDRDGLTCARPNVPAEKNARRLDILTREQLRP
jgi:hypothetical protein